MAAAAAAAQLQTLNPGIIVAPPRLGRQQRGARSPGPLTREEVAMDMLGFPRRTRHQQQQQQHQQRQAAQFASDTIYIQNVPAIQAGRKTGSRPWNLVKEIPLLFMSALVYVHGVDLQSHDWIGVLLLLQALLHLTNIICTTPWISALKSLASIALLAVFGFLDNLGRVSRTREGGIFLPIAYVIILVSNMVMLKRALMKMNR